MGSSPSKNKIKNLILDSLKNNINPDIPILTMEPRFILESENNNYNQKEISIENENIDDLDSLSLNNEINNQKKCYPQNCIGQISFFKNETEYKITGSIIGENIILTLASSIYDFETKNFVSNISYNKIEETLFINKIAINKNIYSFKSILSYIKEESPVCSFYGDYLYNY